MSQELFCGESGWLDGTHRRLRSRGRTVKVARGCLMPEVTSAFEVKITKEPSEVREAQKLRFEVFNLEMKRGLESSYSLGLDADEYDSLCDHLIVRERPCLIQGAHVPVTGKLFLFSTCCAGC